MTYCSNCGNELKEGAKFCDKCGTAVNGGGTGPQHTNINRGTTCQRCGSLVPFGNTACAQCGAPVYKNEHNAAIIIGYLCSVFFPLVGIIIGIYLLTRENKDVHKHGIIMIALAIVISIIVFILFFSYMSYVSRMSYYY